MPDNPAPLVGRDSERKRLRQAVRDTAAGAGQAVLLTGEPGVGKTALLADLKATAATAGFLVLAGQAHYAERGLGYGPVIEAFGPDLGNLGARRASAAVQGLPQLGRLFVGVPGRVEPLGDPAVERSRLVDGLARLCERVTASTPAVAHDRRPALGRRRHPRARPSPDPPPAGRPVPACRDRAFGGRRVAAHPGVRLSAARLELLDELTLAPLGPAEVAALLAHWLPGGTPDDELVADVHRRSGGLPLLVGGRCR